MSTINGSTVWHSKGVAVTTWTPMLNGDSGTLLDAPDLPDKTVIIRGTFGVGGIVVLEGSYSGNSTYNTVQGSLGACSFTAASVEQVIQDPGTLRPRVTAGDGTTSLTVVVISRSTHR